MTDSQAATVLTVGQPIYVDAYQRSVLGTFAAYVDMGTPQVRFYTLDGILTLTAAGQVHARRVSWWT